MLHVLVERNDHNFMALEPSKGNIVLSFKFFVYLIGSEEKPILRSVVHLLPNGRKYIRRIIAECIENATTVDTIRHFSPLFSLPQKITLYRIKVLYTNFQVVGDIAGSYAFPVKALDHEACK